MFTRGAGKPVVERAGFAAIAGERGQECATPIDFNAAEVSLNGAALFGPSDFNKKDRTRTADVTLQAANALDIRLLGRPCGSAGRGGEENDDDGDDSDEAGDGSGEDGEGDEEDDSAKCATLRVRIFGTTPLPRLEAATFVSLDGCCNDPTCNRAAFASAGGVCPGVRRIAGPLPHYPTSSEAEPE